MSDYPRQWVFNGEIWTLVFCRKLDHKSHLGEADPSTCEMRILLGQTPKERFIAVVHEIWHAVGFAYEIDAMENEEPISSIDWMIADAIMENVSRN